MARTITRYRIFYDDGKKGGTIFVGGKKAMQKKLKSLRNTSDRKVKWSLRPVRRNVWEKKK